jgi:glycosyltransferase involved in cell wall biosynthesis
MKRHRIAFVSQESPHDRRSWSGLLAFMFETLQDQCGDVTWLAPQFPLGVIPGKVFNRISRKLLGKGYDYLHSPLIGRFEGRRLDRALKEGRYDVIVAPAASTAIAYLTSSIPVLYLSDITYAQIHEYYDFFSHLFEWSARNGEQIERQAMRRAAAVVYSTTWAANAAVQAYGIDTARVHIVSFGANLVDPPPRDVALTRKLGDQCRLLFLGVNWERKGGRIAVEALRALRADGVDAALTVVGCIPPRDVSRDHLHVIPFLDKNKPAEMGALAGLLAGSDFLLLPTRAEAAGIVFAEASAYGLPTIATRTGGVPDVVVDGENGVLLDIDAGGEAYAKIISTLFRDPVRYRELAFSCRKAFEDRLNWAAWGKRVSGIMNGIVQQHDDLDATGYGEMK